MYTPGLPADCFTGNGTAIMANLDIPSCDAIGGNAFAILSAFSPGPRIGTYLGVGLFTEVSFHLCLYSQWKNAIDAFKIWRFVILDSPHGDPLSISDGLHWTRK